MYIYDCPKQCNALQYVLFVYSCMCIVVWAHICVHAYVSAQYCSIFTTCKLTRVSSLEESCCSENWSSVLHWYRTPFSSLWPDNNPIVSVTFLASCACSLLGWLASGGTLGLAGRRRDIEFTSLGAFAAFGPGGGRESLPVRLRWRCPGDFWS